MTVRAVNSVAVVNEIELIRPEGLFASPAFSQVAIIPPGATTIHVGGQNAVDSSGALVGGDDVAAQTRQVMENMESAFGRCLVRRLSLPGGDGDGSQAARGTVLPEPRD
jgi:enamine deaminase RidA (YjgF/YER057c/UK114 family)